MQSRYYQCPHCKHVFRKDDDLYELAQISAVMSSGGERCPNCAMPLSLSDVYRGKHDVPAENIFAGKYGWDVVQGIFNLHVSGQIRLSPEEEHIVRDALAREQGKSGGGQPASLLTRVVSFIIAIALCGGLAWLTMYLADNALAPGGLLKPFPPLSTVTAPADRGLEHDTNAILPVAYTPDDRYLLSIGSPKQFGGVVIHRRGPQPYQSEAILEIRGYSELVLAVSPDSRHVFAGYCGEDHMFDCQLGEMQLVDIETGNSLWAATGHIDEVRAAAFAPDGRYVASGSCGSREDATSCSQGEILLWDVETGEQVHSFAGHTGAITALAFTPDSRYILSGSDGNDSTLRLWDVETGEATQVFDGVSDGVHNILMLPDGRHAIISHAISASPKHTSLHVWDLETGTYEERFDSDYQIFSTALSSDGQYLVTAACTTAPGCENVALRLWHVDTGTLLHIAYDQSGFNTGHLMYSLAFAPDGRTFVSGSCRRTSQGHCYTGELLFWAVP